MTEFHGGELVLQQQRDGLPRKRGVPKMPGAECRIHAGKERCILIRLFLTPGVSPAPIGAEAEDSDPVTVGTGFTRLQDFKEPRK